MPGAVATSPSTPDAEPWPGAPEASDRPLGSPVDPRLLEQALTHRSYAYENGGLPTNERLEFLGDSVLGLVVTETLYRDHPDLPEGQLAKLRAAVVNMRALAGVGREPGARAATSASARARRPPAAATRPRSWPTRVEALIGAVYVDRGHRRGRRGLRAPALRPAAGPGQRTWVPVWTGRPACRSSRADRDLGVPEYRIVESGP